MLYKCDQGVQEKIKFQRDQLDVFYSLNLWIRVRKQQTKGLCLASGDQQLTFCAGSMLDCVQIDSRQWPKALSSMVEDKKRLCYKIKLIVNVMYFFPASKGSITPFSASVVMEMPYRLCLQLCWLFIHDCKRCFDVRTSAEASDQRSCDWPAVGSVLSLDFKSES